MRSRELPTLVVRMILSLIFDGVWLDEWRVVAVQPKPAFLAYFEAQAKSRAAAHPPDRDALPGKGGTRRGDRDDVRTPAQT
jgi:hypothetical protein